jgi:hypothetical protein
MIKPVTLKPITLRFVTGNDATSQFIKMQAGVCMPWTPIHVEALSRDGKHYVGEHFDGGMQAREIGYDVKQSGRLEKFVTLPTSNTQYDLFHDFLGSKVGEPYDWRAILSFADPAENEHTPNTAICSAIMVLALRAAGYFTWPLTVPAHHISPRDLFLILSTHVEIEH